MKKTASLAACIPVVLSLADCSCGPKSPEDIRQQQAGAELENYGTAVDEWVRHCQWLVSTAAPEALSDGKVDAPLRIAMLDSQICEISTTDGVVQAKCTSVREGLARGDEDTVSALASAARLGERFRYIKDVQGDRARTCACDFPSEELGSGSGECWYAEEDADKVGQVLLTGESHGHVRFQVCSGDCGLDDFGRTKITGGGKFAGKDSKTGKVRTSHDFELRKEKDGRKSCAMDMVDGPYWMKVDKCTSAIGKALKGIKAVSDAVKKRFGAGFIRSEDHQ